MTEKIKRLEDKIGIVLANNTPGLHFFIPFAAEEGEIILAALRVYRKKWEESIEKEKKDAQP
jgi:regulator of protease activity HflC (stomatin/prohibitin superfamily)